MTDDLLKNIDVRVIDQRIGMGVGGTDTVIRLLHKPTGIIVEFPRLHRRGSYYDRQIGMEMIAYALTALEEKSVTDSEKPNENLKSLYRKGKMMRGIE